jgi:hypothetical protein
LAGPLEAPSACYMKSPPVQMTDFEAHALNETFLESLGAAETPAGAP